MESWEARALQPKSLQFEIERAYKHVVHGSDSLANTKVFESRRTAGVCGEQLQWKELFGEANNGTISAKTKVCSYLRVGLEDGGAGGPGLCVWGLFDQCIGEQEHFANIVRRTGQSMNHMLRA
jgi:hypothetical protein